MEAVGDTLGQTMGNIIAKSYDLMVELQPDAVLVPVSYTHLDVYKRQGRRCRAVPAPWRGR